MLIDAPLSLDRSNAPVSRTSLGERFAQDGYVILDNVFGGSELEALRDLTQRIVNYAELRLEDPFTRYYHEHSPKHGVLYDLYQRHPLFAEAARNPQIISCLQDLLGLDLLMYENCLVYKNASSSNAVPWHQDFMSRPTEPRKIIAWIALDDVVEANGAMRIIPGSHKNGFLPWEQKVGEAHHTRVLPQYVDESRAIFAEVKAGSVLIFNQLLLHSSRECHSDRPRRAFRVSYQGMEQILSPRATPIVVAGGDPEGLAVRFPTQQSDPPSAPRKNVIIRGLRWVGRRLANL